MMDFECHLLHPDMFKGGNYVFCRILTILATLGLMLVLPSLSAAREWTSSDGRFTLEADFLDVVGDSTRLRRSDGSVVVVKTNRLADRDRALVRQLKTKSAAKSEGFRFWVNSTGKYVIRAKVVDHDRRRVRLKKEDGSVVQVLLEQLSAHDVALLDKARRSSELDEQLAKVAQLCLKHDFAAAVKNCNEIINAHPTDPGAFIQRARAHAALRQLDLAKRDLAKFEELAQEVDDWKPVYFLSRGQYFYHLKQYRRAISDFDKVIELDQGNRIVLFLRAFTRWRLDELDESLRDVSRYIDSGERDARAYVLRAMIMGKKRQWRKSSEDCSTAISILRSIQTQKDSGAHPKLDPELSAAYATRGSAMFMMGKLDPALKDMNRAIELFPNGAAWYGVRAGIFLGLNRPQDAERDFQKAAKLAPVTFKRYVKPPSER